MGVYLHSEARPLVFWLWAAAIYLPNGKISWVSGCIRRHSDLYFGYPRFLQ